LWENRAGLKWLAECDQELEEPVYVDKEMWEKIVLNLISNALKFTTKGHIRISVKSVLASTFFLYDCIPERHFRIGGRMLMTTLTQYKDPEGKERMAEFTVEDTGVGIPVNELPLLGNRFHRVEMPDGSSQEGTGIGMHLLFFHYIIYYSLLIYFILLSDIINNLA
jgi:signal transduction histidine kinase